MNKIFLMVMICMLVGCDEPEDFPRRTSDPISKYDPMYSVFTGVVVEEPTIRLMSYPPNAIAKFRHDKEVYFVHILVNDAKLTVYSELNLKPEVGKKYCVRNYTKFILCEIKED